MRCLKTILYRSIVHDPTVILERDHRDLAIDSSLTVKIYQHQAFLRTISLVLSDLYSRWARQPYSHAALWEVEDTKLSSIKNEIRTQSLIGIALLKEMPWSIDFHERMKIFRNVMDGERVSVQGTNDPFTGAPRSRGIPIKIRRARILEDGMTNFSRINGMQLKDRIMVRYVNEFGEDEAGIDAGGLFKDFVTDISRIIFNPSYGLFAITADGLLYPNPNAQTLYEARELEEMYIFLGKILGKALYENITLQPQFAHFFLSFINGKYNFVNLINDFSTLDAEMYKNLIFLKNYEVIVVHFNSLILSLKNYCV